MERTLVRGSDSLGDELGVVLHPAEQRRSPSVLPSETEEEQTGVVGDSASMEHAAVLIEHGKVDPVVLRSVARCPDHGIDVELAAVSERHCIGPRRPRLEA